MYRPNAAFDSATRTDRGDYTRKNDDPAPNDKGGTGVLPLLKCLDRAPKLLAFRENLVALARQRWQHQQPGGAAISTADSGGVTKTLVHGADFLHQRPQHHAEQQWRRLELMLDQPVAD